MTLHVIVERLLCLLTIAYVWCVLVGLLQKANFKSHGRRAWSVVTLGLRTLVRSLGRPENQTAVGVLFFIELLMPSQMALQKLSGTEVWEATGLMRQAERIQAPRDPSIIWPISL